MKSQNQNFNRSLLLALHPVPPRSLLEEVFSPHATPRRYRTLGNSRTESPIPSRQSGVKYPNGSGSTSQNLYRLSDQLHAQG